MPVTLTHSHLILEAYNTLESVIQYSDITVNYPVYLYFISFRWLFCRFMIHYYFQLLKPYGLLVVLPHILLYYSMLTTGTRSWVSLGSLLALRIVSRLGGSPTS